MFILWEMYNIEGLTSVYEKILDDTCATHFNIHILN